MEEIRLKPVGVVESGLPRDRGSITPRSRYEVVSTIRVFDEYMQGLKGVEGYSHLIIIYYMHEEKRVKLTIKPWGRSDLPEVGIFATRFPPRPNHIAVSVVELVSIKPPQVLVRGLDAWDGTPVLDIKPYDYYDIVKRPRIPEWALDKWREKAHLYSQIAPWMGPC